jgi:hypothetical protein
VEPVVTLFWLTWRETKDSRRLEWRGGVVRRRSSVGCRSGVRPGAGCPAGRVMVMGFRSARHRRAGPLHEEAVAHSHVDHHDGRADRLI